jgi:putative component of toxin-antitoxin plasmid stabilization module
MTVEERSRRELQEALMETIGPKQNGTGHTDTLFGYLPPTGWADVATTRDVEALRAELRGELAQLRGEVRGDVSKVRGDISELRGEMGHLRAEMHHGLRVQFYSLAGLMVGMLALVVAASSNGLLG